MHSYASDSNDRKIAPWVIGGIAVLVAYAYSAVVARLKIEVPWWVEPPTIMSVYGLCHWLYSRHAWKWRVFGLHLSEIPDYSGAWFGELQSSHAESISQHGLMHIHQTWAELCVELECQKSRSYSLMAVVNVTPGLTEGLTFEYINTPRNDAKETMNAHVGLNHLRLSPDGKILEGDYFSGRGRQTFGRMKLIRIAPGRMTFKEAEAEYNRLVKT